MNRRHFLRGATASGLAVATSTWGRSSALAQGGGARAANGKKLNFLFILADDLGWGDLGCYGNGELRTPSIDKLASQGTLWTQFTVSNPVCSPSRAAFMTGRYPARHGVHGHFDAPAINARRGMPNWLDPSVPTVTQVLGGAGYVTGHFGKWHLGSGPGAPRPEAYGIAHARTDGSEASQKWKAQHSKSSEVIADEIISFLEANRDKPFFINAWLLDPHAPLDPSPEQLAAYPNRRGPSQIFYAAVTDADRHIGRMLARLDELGLAENTVVIFTSDNGPEDMAIQNSMHSAAGSSGPLRGRKRSLYEGGIRVPFIVRAPGLVPANRVDNDSVVSGVDFLPTVCALAGVAPPRKLPLDGEDVSDILRGRPRARQRPLMWEWRYRVFGHPINRSPMLAMRDGRWKLLMNPDRSRVELFDLRADPGERQNMAPMQPQIVAALSPKLLAWHKELPPSPLDADAGQDGYPWPVGITNKGVFF